MMILKRKQIKRIKKRVASSQRSYAQLDPENLKIEILNNEEIKAGDLFIIEDEYNNDQQMNILDDQSLEIK